MSEAAPDAYATLAGLITLLADSKATVKRLDELRRLSTETAEAQAQLAADREEHDRAVAAAKAALDAREAALRKREVDLAGREGRCAHDSEVIAAWKRDHDFIDADLQPGGTLRRARAS